MHEKRIIGIPYAAPDGVPLLLDLYLPVEGCGLHPVILYIHGGGWYTGNRTKPVCLSFVEKGYAVVSIDYRLSGVATFPAQIIDCRNALRWVRTNATYYPLDLERIVIWGISAGGHLAALLGTSARMTEWDGGAVEPVQAVIDFFGPTDFLQGSQDTANSTAARLIGGPITENREKAVAASPITYITSECPPFLIVHGDCDDVVPLQQSELLHQALQQAGISSTLHILRGGRHGFKPEHRTQVMSMVDSFLTSILR